MKVGDIVEVINIDDIDSEMTNWIKKEKVKVKVGDKFKIRDFLAGKVNAILLEELRYFQPIQRFKVVK